MIVHPRHPNQGWRRNLNALRSAPSAHKAPRSPAAAPASQTMSSASTTSCVGTPSGSRLVVRSGGGALLWSGRHNHPTTSLFRKPVPEGTEESRARHGSAGKESQRKPSPLRGRHNQPGDGTGCSPRAEEEYRTLYKAAGFELTRTVATEAASPTKTPQGEIPGTFPPTLVTEDPTSRDVHKWLASGLREFRGKMRVHGACRKNT
jgi:hypothetical protein